MSLLAPELDYDVQNWQPGFFNSPDASAIPMGGTPEAANCLPKSIGPDGSCKLGKRTGALLLNPAAIALGERIDALYDFRREAVAAGELLVVCDGDLLKWDGASAFTPIDTIGTTPGGPVTFDTFRNLAFVMDGSVMKMYDGTDVLDVGFSAPTGAPTLAAGGGTGLTGTYQALVTWYDSTHDHESSPSAKSGSVALVNQDRTHTKPSGSPPANVDFWRIYVRRTDTNETYFKLVAAVPIATASYSEAVADTARNLATNLLAPLPNANDVPPVFAFQANGLGYRLGVQTADSFVWVSALGDPQSQHPKDKIAINRGDGEPVTTVKMVGTTLLVQKATRSWYLQGDRMPFLPKEFRSSFGNHSQTSSVEANTLYYAWDTERGPYVSDLEGRWESLSDGRISDLVATVNTSAEIRCEHFKELNIVAWIVATGASTRQRLMLAYHYKLGSWLPPIYGLEYAAIAAFKGADGQSNLYIGDQWGRVYQYFEGDVEGVPSGDTSAAVTSATSDSVTCAGAAFYTTGDGLAGMPVAAVDPSGNWQFRTIASNTADSITLDTTNGSPWTDVPDSTYTVIVGGIDWFWFTPLIDFGSPMRRKKIGFLYAVARAISDAGAGLILRARFNDTTTALSVSEAFQLRATSAWGSGLWGTMLWGAGGRQSGRARVMRSCYSVQVELSNRYPNQPMEIVNFGLTADGLRGRWSHG